MEQLAAPGRGGLCVEGHGFLYGGLYQRGVIHIDGGLEEEGLWVGRLLGAVPLLEAVVVRGAEGELRFERFVAAAYGVNHLPQPSLGRELVVALQELFRDAPFVGSALRIECNFLTCVCHNRLLF